MLKFADDMVIIIESEHAKNAWYNGQVMKEVSNIQINKTRRQK